jgi:hypothetical protein
VPRLRFDSFLKRTRAVEFQSGNRQSGGYSSLCQEEQESHCDSHHLPMLHCLNDRNHAAIIWLMRLKLLLQEVLSGKNLLQLHHHRLLSKAYLATSAWRCNDSKQRKSRNMSQNQVLKADQ